MLSWVAEHGRFVHGECDQDEVGLPGHTQSDPQAAPPAQAGVGDGYLGGLGVPWRPWACKMAPDGGGDDLVNDEGPEFFHQVQGELGAVVLLGLGQANRRVWPVLENLRVSTVASRRLNMEPYRSPDAISPPAR